MSHPEQIYTYYDLVTFIAFEECLGVKYRSNPIFTYTCNICAFDTFGHFCNLYLVALPL